MANDPQQKNGQFPLGRLNYILLAAGTVVVLLGFILMSGGGTENLNEFHHDEIFSGRRITLAPIVVLLGFGVVLYGIIKKPQS